MNEFRALLLLQANNDRPLQKKKKTSHEFSLNL